MGLIDEIRTRGTEAAQRLPYFRRGVHLIWDALGAWVIVWLALLVVQGIIPAAMVWVTKWLVDSLAAAVGSGLSPDTLSLVLWPAAAIAGLLLLQQGVGSVLEWVNAAQAELVQDQVKNLVHDKAAAVDYAFFETPDYYDRLEQANSQASSRSLGTMQNLGGLVQSSVTFLSIAAILITYSVFLPLVLLVTALPAFAVILRHNRRYHDWWNSTTPARRWAHYFDYSITDRNPAAELRVYGLGEYYKRRYREIRKRLREETLDLKRKQIIARFGAVSLSLVATGGAMAWIVLRALRGLATLGDLALFYQAFNQGQSLMRGLLNNMGQIITNTLFLEHLFDFLDRDTRIKDPEKPASFPARLTRGVRFSNITFRYPGTEKNVLEGFDLQLPAGKMIAIVGANGAGKSTLVKLLCRFYDPAEGSVEVDGLDIRSFRLTDLWGNMAIMMQFPWRHQATVSENIAVGDMLAAVGASDVQLAAEEAGAHGFISRLPRAYNTLLGRMFTDSTDLSGGEWQRIALARAYMRDAQLVVLDEPTSSMDAWAENVWLERFCHLVRDKTTLVITHRFTTARRADLIYVMEGGEIVEEGSHEALISSGGRYAESWYEQTMAHRNDGGRTVTSLL